jgi:hypothetical protein
LIGLTVPEAHRLLRAAALPHGEREHRLRWSRWRRTHQAAAQRGHGARRRRRAPPPPPRPIPIVAVPATADLGDDVWPALRALLPPQRGRGRPYQEHRRVVEGLLWVMHTGHPWRAIPPAFGPWETIHSRYRRWEQDGTWQRCLALLHPRPAASTGEHTPADQVSL